MKKIVEFTIAYPKLDEAGVLLPGPHVEDTVNITCEVHKSKNGLDVVECPMLMTVSHALIVSWRVLE